MFVVERGQKGNYKFPLLIDSCAGTTSGGRGGGADGVEVSSSHRHTWTRAKRVGWVGETDTRLGPDRQL